MRRRSWFALVASALMFTGGCRRAEADLTDPAAIAERMRARAAEDFAGVRDFTVVGDEVLLYFRRAEAATDSLPAFDLRVAPRDAARPPATEPVYVYPVALSRVVSGLRNGARFVGQDTLAGRRVYVLEAPDPATLVDLPPLPAREGGTSARAFVDAETFRLVGMRAALTPQLDSTTAARPVVETHRWMDFQETNGLALPARSRTTIEGLDQLIPEEMRIVEGGNLALQRSQLAQQPPSAERERALRELDRQLGLLRTGVQETSFATREVRVNAGVPDSLFITRLSPLLGAPATPVP